MRSLLGLAFAVVAFTGCHYHGHGHRPSYPSEWDAPAVASVHTHADGCGHHFWHGAWQGSPHPDGCSNCAAPAYDPEPPPTYAAPVYVERPRVYVTHSHHSGCGHFYWHNGWFGHPHPSTCHCYTPRYVAPRISIGFGFGPSYGYRSYGHDRSYGHRSYGHRSYGHRSSGHRSYGGHRR